MTWEVGDHYHLTHSHNIMCWIMVKKLIIGTVAMTEILTCTATFEYYYHEYLLS